MFKSIFNRNNAQQLSDSEFWRFAREIACYEERRRREAEIARRRAEGERRLRQAQMFIWAAARLIEDAERLGAVDSALSADAREVLGEVFEALDARKVEAA